MTETAYQIRRVDASVSAAEYDPDAYDRDDPQYVLELSGEWVHDLGPDAGAAKAQAEGYLTDASWDAEWHQDAPGVWTLVKHYEESREA